MAHLVADHPADAAIVHRRVGVRIEIGRLQDRRWEDDLVEEGVVIGVDGLWGHSPFVAIGGAPQPRRLAPPVPRHRPGVIAHGIAGADVEGRIVPPAVGIAHLHPQLVEFSQGGRPGLRRHPGGVFDPRPIGGAQGLHQGCDLRLGPGGEVAAHIEPAHRLAQGCVHGAGGPLPPLALLGLAGKGAAIEAEGQVVERPRQQVGHAIQMVEGQIGPPGLHRGRAEQGRQPPDRIRLLGAERVPGRDAQGLERRVPGEVGGQGLQLGAGPRIIGEVAVAARLGGPVQPGDPGLQRQDRRGRPRGVRIAGERQHRLGIGLVPDAQVDAVRVAPLIVVAVRQAQAGLGDIDPVAIGVPVVGPDGDGERAGGGEVRPRHQPGDILVAACGGDLRQYGLDGAKARGLDRVGVQIGGVEIRDLPLGRSGRRRAGDQILDDSLHVRLRLGAQDEERSPRGAVGGDGGGGHPRPAPIAEEVVARPDRAVHPGEVEPPGPDGGAWRRGERRVGPQGQAKSRAGKAEQAAPRGAPRRRVAVHDLHLLSADDR